MAGRTPASIVPIRPIVGGAISDYDMTVAMLRELLHADVSRSLFKPRVLVCVPGSITGVEERAMIDAVTEAGARKVYLVESAVATAYGAGLDASKPDGHLIIDIGGGTTETAVVSLGGVSECESIKTAGAAYDDAIIRHIRRRYNVLVGEKTAEELKMAIGSVVPRPETLVEEVKGRDLVTGPAQDRAGLLRRAGGGADGADEGHTREHTHGAGAHTARAGTLDRVFRTASSCPAAAASSTA